MNKYQEALKEIKYAMKVTYGIDVYIKEEYIKTLKELVDKATPLNQDFSKMTISQSLDEWYSIYVYDLEEKKIAKKNYYLIKEKIKDFSGLNIKKYKKAIHRLSKYDYHYQASDGDILFNRKSKEEDTQLLLNLLEKLKDWSKE